MIERKKDLLNIKGLLEHFSIVFLLGPRQIGKTTLAKDLNPDFYYSLDNPKDSSELEKNIDGLSGLIVIDEVHNKPDIFSKVKIIIDSGKNSKFVILGSSMVNFLSPLNNSLIGRAAYYELAGLKLSDINSDINNHILKGGFPNSFNLEIEQSFRYRVDYLRATVNSNLKHSELKLSPHLIQKFLTEIAFISSRILNKTQLSNLLSISRSTIDTYLNFFEHYYVLRLIPNLNSNKSPKIVFRDSGIHNCLLNIESLEQLKTSSYYYHVWESYVIESIISEYSVRNPSYFMDKSGTEIDLITETNNKNYGFIFSNSGTFTAKDKIKDLIENLNLNTLFVINNINLTKKIGNKIITVPLEKLDGCITKNLIPKKTRKTKVEAPSMAPLKVFISYSHKDSEFVLKLKEKLEKKNVEIYIDIEKLKYGDNIKDFISNTVKATNYTIQVISINSLRSPYVMIEYLETQLYQIAKGVKKYVPIFIDNSIFKDNTYIDLADDIQKEINEVNGYINKAIKRNLQSTPYNTKRERLIDLLNSLGKAIETLRESLIGDFTDDKKIDKNILQIINSIENKSPLHAG